MSDQDSPPTKPTLWQVIGGVLAAGFGVQSEKNRLRDFQSASPKRFVLAGVVGTILFILTLYTVVRLVLAFAGS